MKMENLPISEVVNHPDRSNLQISPLNLSFNCTCWQNRRARIYLEGARLSESFKLGMLNPEEFMPTYLILSQPVTKKPPAILKNPDGQNVPLFCDYNSHSQFFEIQVWRRLKDGRLVMYLPIDPSQPIKSVALTVPPKSANYNICTCDRTSAPMHFQTDKPFQPFRTTISQKLDDVNADQQYYYHHYVQKSEPINPSESIKITKVGTSKDRLYCTIDCIKGLKVQNLILVGILRIGDTLYVSPYTPFPPPSSKRRLNRIDFYHRLHDQKNAFLPAKRPLLSQEQHLSETTQVPSAMEKKISWNHLIQEIQELPNAEYTYQVLELLISIGVKFEHKQPTMVRTEILEWFYSNNVPCKLKLRLGMMKLFYQSVFFGPISSTAASDLLMAKYYSSPSCGYYLIRFSSYAICPYLELQGVIADQQMNAIKPYSATIKFDIENTSRNILYWLDNEQSSIRNLTELLEHISTLAYWSPLSRDEALYSDYSSSSMPIELNNDLSFLNDPYTTLSGSALATASSPSNSFFSHPQTPKLVELTFPNSDMLVKTPPSPMYLANNDVCPHPTSSVNDPSNPMLFLSKINDPMHDQMKLQDGGCPGYIYTDA
ncbi:uncharacterized protein LOC126318613 isoform X2 [Schistocerca gregaria]|uniref:uncharacterized protein LOC126318613 isoform X2 n=1 Tax=Schistocerca gregaria TaxID=7010 RepID=UPI00211E2FBA|nr:uncharacterized protein LOC126318613 isoform X2 [Schistocerca gregaria]